MTPLSLLLDGYVGISDGLGRTIIELDFRDLPLGLIAIVAPNGHGKTTIMDNLHPYRIMPSRTNKKYTVGSFSFFEHLLAGKARKIFEWKTIDERIFKSELHFTTKTRKTECYLFEWVNFEWVPFKSGDGLIISDGKTENYDRAIESLIGSPELFFTSRFLAQNKRALSSYETSDIKALLSEMLELESLKNLSKKSGEVVVMLSQELQRLQAQYADLSKLPDKIGQEEESLKQTSLRCVALKDNKSKLEESKQQLQRQLQVLENSQKLNLDKVQRIQELSTLKQKIALDIEQQNKVHQSEIQSRLANQTVFKRQVENANKTLLRAKAVEDSILKLPMLTKQLAQAELDIAAAESQLQTAREVKLKIDKLNADLQSKQEIGAAASQRVVTIYKQIQVMDVVPCSSISDMQNECPLLEMARQASAQYEGENKSLLDIRNSYRETKNLLEEIRQSSKELAPIERALKLSKESLAKLRLDVQSTSEVANQKPLLDQAQGLLTEATQQLSILDKQAVQSLENFKGRMDSLQASLNSANKELESLNALDVSNEIIQTKRKLNETAEALIQIEVTIEETIRTESRFHFSIEKLKNDSLGLKQLNHVIVTLSNEIAVWKQLTMGLGNNGLIALCIDDAGPLLSQLVNQLLGCYGSQFAIEIKTQKESLAGTISEGFEILVHDAVKGKTKRLDYMSGGEKVWINDCLCRGIALYLAQKGTHQCATLFSDETDGALDIERKRQFMKMKHLVLKLSGCTREFFISHTPDCIEIADHVIDLQALV